MAASHTPIRLCGWIRQQSDGHFTGGQTRKPEQQPPSHELDDSHVPSTTFEASLQAINQLLDKQPQIAHLTGWLDEFPEHSETIAENLSTRRENAPVHDRFDTNQLSLESLPKVAEAAEKLVGSHLIDGLTYVIAAAETLFDPGMLHPDMVRTLGELGVKGESAYHEGASQPVVPVGGLMAAYKATENPEVERSLGFFLRIRQTLEMTHARVVHCQKPGGVGDPARGQQRGRPHCLADVAPRCIVVRP